MTVSEPRYRLEQPYVQRRVGKKLFVLDEAGSMTTLDNDTAVTLWDALESAGERGASPGELAAALAERFEVEEDEARRDAAEFLGELEKLRLVRRLD